MFDYLGQLKFSPDGSRLAHPYYNSNFVLLCDFDAAKGIISNGQQLPLPPTTTITSAVYGIEFSASGRYLYCANPAYKIFQWDLNSSNITDITNSRQLIGEDPEQNGLGCLQLAKDGKIYVARSYSNFLGVIENPESPGVLSNYIANAIDLSPRISVLGLPTFIQSFNYIPFSISAQNFCTGLPTQFSASTTATLTNYQWHFGDSASGANNTSTIATPMHSFTAPGQYTVTLTASAGNSNYTQTLVVDILPAPAVPVIYPAGPLQLCAGTAQNLQAAALPGLHYQWLHNSQPLPNDTLPALTVSAPGSYQLLVTDSVCAALSDSVQVTVLPPANAQISPQNPPPVCHGQSASLSAGQSSGNTFSWLHNGQPVSGANGPVFAASSPGSYQVVASYGGLCPDTSVAVAVTILPAPVAEVSPGVVPAFCAGQTATLTAGSAAGYNYQWLHNSQPVLGANGTEFTFSSPGHYQLVVIDAACSDTSGAVLVTVHPLPLISITQLPGANCPGPVTLVASGADSYIWSTGTTTAQIVAHPAEGSFYSVTGQNQFGCSGSDSVLIALPDCPDPLLLPNIISPNNDGVNDALVINTLAFDLQVFNRWGKQVFSQKNYHRQQDWKADGLPDGVYFYSIKTSTGQLYKSWLEVLR